nr:Abi family protein [Halorhodospira sp. 9628]
MLQGRGLSVPDTGRAHRYLANISYYRLSAYMRPFYQPGLTEHRFLSGTTFDDVLDLYVFDRELRLLLLDAVERLEVALRAQLANTLAEHHGPHGYLDPAIFDDRYNHAWLLERLDNAALGRDAEAFLVHYRQKYRSAPNQPPIWMAVELLTFKEVSTLFSQLRLAQDTQRIEKHFGWRFPVLRSWFRSLSDLRNLCAHHSRVWNREFGSRPEMPKKIRAPWPDLPQRLPTGSKVHPEQSVIPQRRLYMQVIVIESLMQAVSPGSRWAGRLAQLLSRYPSVSRAHMGFPGRWDEDPFWADAIRSPR